MTGQDVQPAVHFLVEEKARKILTKQENIKRQAEISFEKDLAAEALSVNENEVKKALDLLTNPERNCALQLGVSDSSGAAIEELVTLWYNRSSVVDALKLLVGANSEDSQHATIDLGGEHKYDQPKDDQGPSAALANDDKIDLGGEHKYERDEVLEDELAKELTGDPLADYDTEVMKEGEAIAKYLALLDSKANAT